MEGKDLSGFTEINHFIQSDIRPAVESIRTQIKEVGKVFYVFGREIMKCFEDGLQISFDFERERRKARNRERYYRRYTRRGKNK